VSRAGVKAERRQNGVLGVIRREGVMWEGVEGRGRWGKRVGG